MAKSVFILEWYGPFSNPQDIKTWEEKGIGSGKTYLYIFKGKKPRSKTKQAIYCGQAFKQSAGKRLSNKGHHIQEVIAHQECLEIWVAKFQNKPSKDNVNLVERVLTSVIDQVERTDTLEVLNEINKYRPHDLAYIINEWYKVDGTPRLNYKSGSICSLMNDVLICYPDNENKVTNLWGTKKLKYIAELK